MMVRVLCCCERSVRVVPLRRVSQLLMWYTCAIFTWLMAGYILSVNNVHNVDADDADGLAGWLGWLVYLLPSATN